jgi:hypothetical protein
MAVAALAVTADMAVIGVWAWSATAVAPLAVAAVAASLIRIACSVITVWHATAIYGRLTPIPDGRTTVQHRDAGA